jgi:hypothetical protein
MEERTTAIEDEVYQRAARLLAIRDAVAEEFGGRKVPVTDPADLKEIVRRFRQAIAAVPDAYGVIVGGIAVQELGYVRWTEDVDAVVDAAHYREVLDVLRSNGFLLQGDFTLVLREAGVKLDLLKEGVTLKDSRFPLPHPSELGPNKGFVKLGWLIRLKMDAHRRQDVADIVRVMQSHLGEADAICAGLPDVFRKEFMELVAEARHEAGTA